MRFPEAVGPCYGGHGRNLEEVFVGDYANRVFKVVRQIPRGKVATYGQVARLIGSVPGSGFACSA